MTDQDEAIALLEQLLTDVKENPLMYLSFRKSCDTSLDNKPLSLIDRVRIVEYDLQLRVHYPTKGKA